MRTLAVATLVLSLFVISGPLAQTRSSGARGPEREHRERIEYRSTAAIQEPGGFTKGPMTSARRNPPSRRRSMRQFVTAAVVFSAAGPAIWRAAYASG